MPATRQKDLCGIEGKPRVAASPRLEFPHHRLRPLPPKRQLVTRWKKGPVSMTSKWMLVGKGASQNGRHGARIHSCCHADASYRLYYPVVPLLIQPVHQIKHQRGVAWISMSGIKKKVTKKMTPWAGSHQRNQFGILRRCGGWVTIWDLTGSLNRLGLPPPRTALCQDQRLEPVLRQSALVHDLTLHDRTALRWKLEQEKRLWIAFCTRQPKPTAETCSHVGHDLHGQFEQEGELTPIPDVHTHTNASATINGLKRVNCNVIKKIC